MPAWLLPGLAGTGAVFGAAFWIVLRAQRRTQLRWRRPGRIIAPPPPDVVQAEKTARVTATSLAPHIQEFDAALKSLEPTKVRILTATLTGEDIGITLAAPVDLAAPWTGSGAAWRIALADVPQGREAFPPYPLLVSVGHDDDGAFVFLNLEELRVVSVTGDPDRKAAFARHLAAELAVNPWSIVNHVHVLGLGSDLASFHLGRVSTHPAGDTAFIATLAEHVSEHVPGSDPDDFYAAIIATADRPDDELDALAEALEGFTGRTAAALIDLARRTPPDGHPPEPCHRRSAHLLEPRTPCRRCRAQRGGGPCLRAASRPHPGLAECARPPSRPIPPPRPTGVAHSSTS